MVSFKLWYNLNTAHTLTWVERMLNEAERVHFNCTDSQYIGQISRRTQPILVFLAHRAVWYVCMYVRCRVSALPGGPRVLCGLQQGCQVSDGCLQCSELMPPNCLREHFLSRNVSFVLGFRNQSLLTRQLVPLHALTHWPTHSLTHSYMCSGISGVSLKET